MWKERKGSRKCGECCSTAGAGGGGGGEDDEEEEGRGGRGYLTKKASPMFLFGSPWNSTTLSWSLRATPLTSFTTSACSTSVSDVKFLMSQKPKKALTIEPGLFVSSAEMVPLASVLEMTLAPASPNPSWSRRARLKRPDSIFFIWGWVCRSQDKG